MCTVLPKCCDGVMCSQSSYLSVCSPSTPYSLSQVLRMSLRALSFARYPRQEAYGSIPTFFPAHLKVFIKPYLVSHDVTDASNLNRCGTLLLQLLLSSAFSFLSGALKNL